MNEETLVSNIVSTQNLWNVVCDNETSYQRMDATFLSHFHFYEISFGWLNLILIASECCA